VILRDPRPSDADVLVQLIGRYFAHDHIPFDEEAVRRGLVQLLADQRLGHAWMVELDSAIAGYAIVTFGFDLEMGGRFALLTDLYLERSLRGSGLGMKILAEIERRLVDMGVVTFELTVERGNTHAQALYRKAGFSARDRFPMTKRIS
jgi:diamine N-acetyltransferase